MENDITEGWGMREGERERERGREERDLQRVNRLRWTAVFTGITDVSHMMDGDLFRGPLAELYQGTQREGWSLRLGVHVADRDTRIPVISYFYRFKTDSRFITDYNLHLHVAISIWGTGVGLSFCMITND